MIESRWWDAFILVVKYGDGRLEVRLGVACLLVIVVVAGRLVRSLASRGSPDS